MAKPQRVEHKPGVVPYPSEFTESYHPHEQAAREILGFSGRMIGASKGRYRQRYPEDLVVFNSNIVTSERKIWHGDINVTRDLKFLKQLANKLSTNIYVMYESDARFEKETNYDVSEAAALITADGTVSVRDHGWYYVKRGVPKQHTQESYDKAYPEEVIARDLANRESAKKLLNETNSKKDEFKAVKIPDMSEFKTRSKKESPLDRLHKALIDMYGKKKAQFLVLHMYLPKSWHEEFNNLLTEYCKKVMKLDDYETGKSVGWACFSTPCNLQCDPAWAKSGYGYVRKDQKETESDETNE